MHVKALDVLQCDILSTALLVSGFAAAVVVGPTAAAAPAQPPVKSDLVRWQRISDLGAGVNLAGIARILELDDRNDALEGDNAALEDGNAVLRVAEDRRNSAKR